MTHTIFHTEEDWKLTILRVVLGCVYFVHGAQKVLGWFGGYGFSATMHSFTTQMGIPEVFAFLAILAEFAGGLGLIAGLLGRIAAFGIGVEMLVAVAMVHSRFGFFMNWSGQQAGEGFEYHLLAIAMCAAVVIGGSGALSVDRWLDRREHTHGHAHPIPA